MRAIVVLVTLVFSVPAFAQNVMYVRPPRAVLCDRLDMARVAVQVASEAYRSGRAGAFPSGCWEVKPATPVTVLDQFDDYAYIGIGVGTTQQASARAWVHIGALSNVPETPPPARRRR